jgi:hypothetical protein
MTVPDSTIRARRASLPTVVAAAVMSSAALVAMSGGKPDPIVPLQADPKRGIVPPLPFVVRDLGFEKVHAYDGTTFMAPVIECWRPICGSSAKAFAPGVLESCIDDRMRDGGEGEVTVVDSSQSFVGPDFVFTVSGDVPPQAIPAIAAIERCMEGLFSDPVTVRVSIAFGPLPAGVLGTTGAPYLGTTFAVGRNGIVAGRDPNDAILQWMPTGSTVGVRYANAATVTAEDRVFWTRANLKATVGDSLGSDATITFNSSIAWDFDPADGVTGYSFRDVLAHEMGHVLGFGSGIDFLTKDITAMDMFRFPSADGSADYNPDTYAEFRARPRLAAFNAPDEGHILDLVAMEIPMSDGSPYQASHLLQQSPSLGLMSPALAPGTTRAPDYFGVRDLAVLDALGWDR